MNISFSKQTCYKRLIWNFNNVNESELHNSLLAMDLESQIDCEDINIVYKNWFDCFRGIVELYIPHKTVTIRPRDKPWMNTTVRRAIRKRNRLLKIHCRVKSLVSWEKYRQQRNYTTALIRYNKQKYYKKLNSKLQDPSISNKNWWGIVKSLNGAKIQTSIPTLVEGVKFISDAKEKAELFNEYFCTQCSVDDSCATLATSTVRATATLSLIQTSNEEVNILLKSVDVGKACGFDGIGNRILKLCANGISSSLSGLANHSFLFGKFPDNWKRANVIPVFKKDDRQSKLNYRPVSLLVSLSKIVEKIVYIRLYNFLLEIGFLNPLQSGFWPGDSTVNQLTYLVHKIFYALEQGKEARMVFLDISKAFDKVWHKGLLYKLELIGIRNPLLG